MVTANWGGHWGEEHLEEHMNQDLRTIVCQVVAMQESEPKCMEFLNEPIRGGSDLGKGGLPVDNPAFIGSRGNDQKDNSLLIAARPSLVTDLRLKVLERKIDGLCTEKG